MVADGADNTALGELLGIGERVFFLTLPELLAALDGQRDALDLLERPKSGQLGGHPEGGER